MKGTTIEMDFGCVIAIPLDKFVLGAYIRYGIDFNNTKDDFAKSCDMAGMSVSPFFSVFTKTVVREQSSPPSLFFQNSQLFPQLTFCPTRDIIATKQTWIRKTFPHCTQNASNVRGVVARTARRAFADSAAKTSSFARPCRACISAKSRRSQCSAEAARFFLRAALCDARSAKTTRFRSKVSAARFQKAISQKSASTCKKPARKT